jgi:hypothetical protein
MAFGEKCSNCKFWRYNHFHNYCGCDMSMKYKEATENGCVWHVRKVNRRN